MHVTPDWTIVFNPRTGSRSLAVGLRVAGFQHVEHAHVRPEQVIGDRVIGVIRNPVTWVWSFYYTSQMYPLRFEEWLEKFHDKQVGIGWARPRLNAYHSVITDYWLYERGIDGLLAHLGYPNLHFPRRGYKPKPIAPYDVPAIRKYFAEDWDQYHELLMNQDYSDR